MVRGSVFTAVTTVTGLTLALLSSPRGYADDLVDDFESYAEGSAIATSAVSQPWLKFGNPTSEVTVVGGAINSSQSGRFTADWSVGSFAGTEFNFGDGGVDLSGFNGVTITVMSEPDGSNASGELRAVILGAADNDGYQIKDAGLMALSNTPTAYHFSFDPSEWELSDPGNTGAPNDSFSSVLANAKAIGFAVMNSGNFTEIITFDDLTLTPEPVSAVMLGVVGMMLVSGGRRRMRRA